MGSKKAPLPKIGHIYPTMMKLGTVIPYLQNIEKIWITWHSPWVLLTLKFFTRNQQSLLSQEIQIQIAFWYIISNSLNFFGVFKDCFNKRHYNLMKSAKMATLGLLKRKAFWNKGYDAIVSVHDVANRILSRDTNYIVDVVMWPKFDNSSISIREVIITSILQGFEQKNHFFWEMVFVQVH